jgi:hypothetical protein
MPECVAIKANGTACGRNLTGENQTGICKIHQAVIRRKGPHTVARHELERVQHKELKEFDANYHEQWRAAQGEERRVLTEEYRIQRTTMLATHMRQGTDLNRRQREEVRVTGVNPDDPARERQRLQDQERRDLFFARRLQQQEQQQQQQQRQHIIHVDQEVLNNINLNNIIGLRIDNRIQVAAPVGELARFATDPQNVHTTDAVKKVKEIIEKVLEVDVPAEYKWNIVECSKTPGEIILECKLTPRAAWQMSAMYCADSEIYDMGKGIYGRVLDCVWQFILKSEHKQDLCRILKSELQDNIGMCAQGNLSRLANILAGYMDGVKSQESLSEILGRELPPLIEIEDAGLRMIQFIEKMQENNVPPKDWLIWAEPLFDGYRVKYGSHSMLELVEI